MIALLPLRGWMGDVMAVEMASENMNATNLVAIYVYPTRATGQFDGNKAAPAHLECPEHAAMALGPATESIDTVAPADVATASDDTANGHCNTCGVCQICHTVALANDVASNAPDFTPHPLPSMGSTHFASALTALGQKPPIS